MITLKQRKLLTVESAVNRVIEDVITTSPQQSKLFINGLASFQTMDQVDFATRVDSEGFGELLGVGPGENLPLAELPGFKLLEHTHREYGAYVNISQQRINDAAKEIVGTNANITLNEAIPQAKERLRNVAIQQLTTQTINTVLKNAWGAAQGSIAVKAKSGNTETITFNVTNGGSVSTTWSNAASPIIADMQAIEVALKALSDRVGSLRNGKTLMDSSVLNNILNNTGIINRYQGAVGTRALPILSDNVNPSGLLTENPMQSLFGDIIVSDEFYRPSSGAASTWLDGNYIIHFGNGKFNPLIDVIVAPTQYDPRFTNSTSSGFAIYENDGIIDETLPAHKVGSYTVGIRGRIAVRIVFPTNIYLKRVIL